MRKSLRLCEVHPDKTLTEIAWSVRDSGRRHGRQVPRRCISTTLLVKGLEFDYALVLDANDFDDAENLYVALTRGAKGLQILSSNRVLKWPLPHFKLPA